MNILLLGSGGREHALAWKVSQSPMLTRLYIAPGNGGTAQLGINVNIQATDFIAIKKFVLDNEIQMVVVGPEDPLVKGIHDFFLDDIELKHIPVIGPCKKAAQLEGSKDFAKSFMHRHNIPTARYHTFNKENLEQGYLFLEKSNPPYVLKADGLAAGKGVVILNSLAGAKEELKAMIKDEKFGNASSRVVIEEFLNGIELSVFVLTDGISFKILPEAKDYKRIGQNDTGPNTGGMGAISPVPFVDGGLRKKIEEKIIIPTINGLKTDNIPYSGFIFFGLIKVGNEPYVIEYNVRMGDPETEAVMPRIKSDLVELFVAVGEKRLAQKQMEINPHYSATVMMVSGGYPADYEKGKIISGLNDVTDSIIFHAGTEITEKNELVTAGGRVLAITSTSDKMTEAIKKSYASAQKISYYKMYCRNDIGKDLEKYL